MRFIPILTVALTVAACVPTPQVSNMMATSGDRQAGVLQMSTAYDPAVKTLSPRQAKAEADSRCKAWGYAYSLPFEDRTQSCESPGADGSCHRLRVTQTFQCAVGR